MAQAELCHGQNERRIAQEIIVTQQQTAAMRLALGQPLPVGRSPDQWSDLSAGALQPTSWP
jgi:hypothetical protein